MRLIESISENDWPLALVLVVVVIGTVVVLMYLFESWRRGFVARRDFGERIHSLESRVSNLQSTVPSLVKQVHELEEIEMGRKSRNLVSSE